jgi:flavin-binding protein dodecin
MTSKIMTHHISKIVEIVGNSDNGWQDAIQGPVDEAKKMI